MKKTVPIIILSGFLGSGKTTLLTKALEHYTKSGKRPAVIMNEVGDVNLDGQQVEASIPMREMLSGCICCTIRGDLGLEIQNLVDEFDPEMIIIEATGVANPMEILDAVTEAALLVRIEVQAVITVVDAVHFLHWQRRGKGRTYRLMQDQIRCASLLLLNKSDLVSPSELQELEQSARELNAHALLRSTVYCAFDPMLFDLKQEHVHEPHQREGSHVSLCEHAHHEHHEHQHEETDHHHSYDHVMVYTHYFEQPFECARLEQIIGQLPEGVYRAKGIFTSAETGERMMFQYAFRELDVLRIRPQGNVQDVAVFIGEQFLSNELKAEFERISS